MRVRIPLGTLTKGVTGAWNLDCMKLNILPLMVSGPTRLEQRGYQIVCFHAKSHWLFRQSFETRKEAELVSRRIGRFGFDSKEWELLPDVENTSRKEV